MNMFSQNEILLMILVVSVLLIFIVVLTILDIREYKREKNKDILDDLDLPILDESSQEEEKPLIMPMDDVEVLEVSDINDDVLSLDNVDDSIELNMVEEKELPVMVDDFKETNEEVKIEEFVPKKLSINEELKHIEETMVDTDEALENTITSFEEEQERTAIISLDELLKHSDNLYAINEEKQYDDSDVPISVDEIINNSVEIEQETVKDVAEPMVLKEALKEEKELYTHKEDMPFISSIYGIESDEMSFENTANFEKMDRAKTNEFMRRLKEMSENK